MNKTSLCCRLYILAYLDQYGATRSTKLMLEKGEKGFPVKLHKICMCIVAIITDKTKEIFLKVYFSLFCLSKLR